MAINLQKGQTINLRKNELGNEVHDLSSVTIGLGWDVRKTGGFFSRLLGITDGPEYDLDAIAFLLDEDGNVANMGKTFPTGNGREVVLYQSDVIYFNSMRHPSGKI